MSSPPAVPALRSVPKLLFVDDHHMLLDALACLTQPEFEVRSTSSLADLMPVLQSFQPDLLILDLRMPDGDPMQVAKDLLRSNPNVKIMFLSMYTGAKDVKRAMQVGVRAYVSKRATAKELISAIQTVLSGGRYVSPQTEMISPGDDVECPLTERQKQVLALIAHGASAKEIAAELQISVRTAEFHRATIMERLHLNSTAMLTRYAVDHGLA